MNRDNREVVASQGISLVNDCYYCIQLNELCIDCQESREARDSDIAHEMVDERNLTYLRVWSKPKDWTHDNGSNHQWTDRDGEYIQPVVDMADRFFDLEDAIELTSFETVCSNCHYVICKHVKCPNCG